MYSDMLTLMREVSEKRITLRLMPLGEGDGGGDGGDDGEEQDGLEDGIRVER